MILNTFTLKRLVETNQQDQITQELCNEAMKQNSYSIQWIPEKFRTYDIYKIARYNVDRMDDYFSKQISDFLVEKKLFRPDGSWNTAGRGKPEEDRLVELNSFNKYFNMRRYRTLKKNLETNILLDKWEYDPANIIHLPFSLQKERLAETFTRLNDKDNPELNEKLANVLNILSAQSYFNKDNENKFSSEELQMYLTRFVAFRTVKELGGLDTGLLNKENLVTLMINDISQNKNFDNLHILASHFPKDDPVYETIYKGVFSQDMNIPGLLNRIGPFDHQKMIDYAISNISNRDIGNKPQSLNMLWDTNNKDEFFKEIVNLNSNLYFIVPKDQQTKLKDFASFKNSQYNDIFIKEFLDNYPYFYNKLPEEYKNASRQQYAEEASENPKITYASCWTQDEQIVNDLVSHLKSEDLTIKPIAKEKELTASII